MLTEYRKGPPDVAAKLAAAGWVYEDGRYRKDVTLLELPGEVTLERIAEAKADQGYWHIRQRHQSHRGVWSPWYTCNKATNYLGRFLQTEFRAGW